MTAHSPDTPAATTLGTDASGVVAEARTRVGFIRLVRRYPTIAIGGTLVLLSLIHISEPTRPY